MKKEATFEDVETLAKMHKFSNALNACDEYLRSNMEQAKSERKLKELNPGAKKRSKEEMARMVAEAFSSKGKGKKEVRTTRSIETRNHGTGLTTSMFFAFAHLRPILGCLQKVTPRHSSTTGIRFH